MLKPYEITVTYRLYATNEKDATGQVLNNMVEPETIDVLDLPTRQRVEVDIVPF